MLRANLVGLCEGRSALFPVRSRQCPLSRIRAVICAEVFSPRAAAQAKKRQYSRIAQHQGSQTSSADSG
jgi:hypothetical protein